MKLIDRLSLQRLLSMLLNFVLNIVKLLSPAQNNDKDKPKRPRWRKQ